MRLRRVRSVGEAQRPPIRSGWADGRTVWRHRRNQRPVRIIRSPTEPEVVRQDQVNLDLFGYAGIITFKNECRGADAHDRSLGYLNQIVQAKNSMKPRVGARRTVCSQADLDGHSGLRREIPGACSGNLNHRSGRSYACEAQPVTELSGVSLWRLKRREAAICSLLCRWRSDLTGS
jgi:hypothetical protein